jgi:3-oxoacyl-[acyl-carrier protein] reductase
VSRREDVEQAVRRIVEQNGHIDVVVNNAGLNRPVFTRLSLDEGERRWDEVLSTNLKGAFLVSVAAASHLPRPGGRIINISSVAAFTGGRVPGGIAYAASKAGLLGLTYGLAAELAPEGITVNAVAPGLIVDTERTDRWPAERRRSFVANTPAGRAGSPKDVAAVVRFLASPEASFLNGAVIPADGGWLFGRGSFQPDEPGSATP